MRTVAILQARLGSSRLPKKMLLPLAGAPLVQHVIDRTKRAKLVDMVVLAFPIRDVEAFSPITRDRCESYGYPLDERDLVDRYRSAAAAHGAEIVVRIPCDNPCVDPFYIDQAIDKYLSNPSIYVSTMYRHVHDHVYLDGVGAEVFSMSRLRWLDQATKGQANYREHLHLLFQDYHLIDGVEQYKRYANVSETIRLDVNTRADYEFVKSIYDHFGHNEFTTNEVLAYLGHLVTA